MTDILDLKGGCGGCQSSGVPDISKKPTLPHLGLAKQATIKPRPKLDKIEPSPSVDKEMAEFFIQCVQDTKLLFFKNRRNRCF